MPDEEKTPALTRAQFEANIVAKAWNDPEYKKRLLANPNAVIEEELKAVNPAIKLPDTLQIYIHEETPNALHITLPANPSDYPGATSEGWLDDVDGGMASAVVPVIVGPNPPVVSVFVTIGSTSAIVNTISCPTPVVNVVS